MAGFLQSFENGFSTVSRHLSLLTEARFPWNHVHSTLRKIFLLVLATFAFDRLYFHYDDSGWMCFYLTFSSFTVLCKFENSFLQMWEALSHDLFALRLTTLSSLPLSSRTLSHPMSRDLSLTSSVCVIPGAFATNSRTGCIYAAVHFICGVFLFFSY